MNIDVITLFPDIFDAYCGSGVIKRVQEQALVKLTVHNLRSWTSNVHQTVDDRPFGGGDGMLLKPEILASALRDIKSRHQPSSRIMFFTAQGVRWNQQLAAEFSNNKNWILVPGRYAGFDDRLLREFEPLEVSMGDFVISGGELAALMVLDSAFRLLPGVLGHQHSHLVDSFAEGYGGLLEGPQFTRPAVWEERKVPSVLTNGHHGDIDAYHRAASLVRSFFRRPDLIFKRDQLKALQGAFDLVRRSDPELIQAELLRLNGGAL